MPATSGDHLDLLLPAYVNGSLDPRTAERVRAHLATCRACQAELTAWEAIGAAVEAAVERAVLPSAAVLAGALASIDEGAAPQLVVHRFAPADDPTGPPDSAAARGNSRTSFQGWHPGPARPPDSPTTAQVPWYERIARMAPLNRQRLLRPLLVAAAAAVIAGGVLLTPAGSYAQSFLNVFTPQQFVAVPVTTNELQGLPDLNNYGTYSNSAHRTAQRVASAAAAAQMAGIAVQVPSTLPSGVPANVTYTVMPGSSASFTFSAAKARATAAAQGKSLPPMPANIDGSTVQASLGPVVIASYGNPPPTSGKSAARTANAVAGKASAGDLSSADLSSMPVLVIAQTTAPVINATGATVPQLEQYLLAQPGISPDLVSAIKAIGDPTTTLPIPVPINKATSHPVQVQGVTGLAVADSSGLGGGIIWETGGKVYGVAGALPESDLLAIANSLH